MSDILSGSDFQTGLGQLRLEGLLLPYGIIPGSVPGGDDFPSSRVKWDAYQWNPPGTFALGYAYRTGPWRGPFQTFMERLPDSRTNDFAYRVWSAGDPPATPGPTDADMVPTGWSRGFIAPRSWYIGRKILRIEADRALTDPDPDASVKPTWDEILTALFRARLRGAVNEVLLEYEFFSEGYPSFRPSLLSVICEDRIRRHAFNAKSPTHEHHIREGLQQSGEADDTAKLSRMFAHREFLKARYHEIKGWVQSKVAVGTEASIVAINELFEKLSSPEDNDLWTGATWIPPGETEPFTAYDQIPPYRDEAPPGKPPVELKVEFLARAGTTYHYRLIVTAAAEIHLHATVDAVSFPVNPIVTERGAVVEFTAEAPRGTPTFMVTATASPYGEEKTATLETEGDDELAMGAALTATAAEALWQPADPPLVPPAFVVSGRQSYARHLRLVATSSQIEFRTSSRATSGFVGSASGPEMIHAWEVGGSLRIRAAGGTLTVPAPNVPGIFHPDPNEPYVWRVQGQEVEFVAFVAAVEAAADKTATVELLLP